MLILRRLCVGRQNGVFYNRYNQWPTNNKRGFVGTWSLAPWVGALRQAVSGITLMQPVLFLAPGNYTVSYY
jgi:hypothetical protein